MFIGERLNAYEDDLDVADYLDRWINPYVARSATTDRATSPRRWQADLRVLVERHCASIPAAATCWGWKEPRSIYLLPFLHAQMPSLRFLHFVRDGRDMALSENQNQLIKHGSVVLGGARVSWRRPVRSIALWSRANCAAADYCERELGDAYLRVRFEDLCAEPSRDHRSDPRALRPRGRRRADGRGRPPARDAGALAEEEPPAGRAARAGRWRRAAPLRLPVGTLRPCRARLRRAQAAASACCLSAAAMASSPSWRPSSSASGASNPSVPILEPRPHATVGDRVEDDLDLLVAKSWRSRTRDCQRSFRSGMEDRDRGLLRVQLVAHEDVHRDLPPASVAPVALTTNGFQVS